jgi:hypothetical protein
LCVTAFIIPKKRLAAHSRLWPISVRTLEPFSARCQNRHTSASGVSPPPEECRARYRSAFLRTGTLLHYPPTLLA